MNYMFLKNSTHGNIILSSLLLLFSTCLHIRRAARYESRTERSCGHHHFPEQIYHSVVCWVGWARLVNDDYEKRGKHGIQNLYVVHVGWGMLLSH